MPRSKLWNWSIPPWLNLGQQDVMIEIIDSLFLSEDVFIPSLVEKRYVAD